MKRVNYEIAQAILELGSDLEIPFMAYGTTGSAR